MRRGKMEYKTITDVFKEVEINELIERMELLRRDPNSASWGIIDPTPEEAEAKRMAAECANDMLDDCIAIVKEVFGNDENSLS